MYDAQNSINIVNHTTVRVQFLSRSKNKSRGLKLTFDIKDITLAEITITTSYYFFGDFTVLLKPFLDERWVKIRNTFERFRPRSRHGRDPFNQNFRKFRSKTQWIGSVQPEKFRKNGSTFWGGPLFPVGPVGNLVEWIAPNPSAILTC